MIRPGHIDVVVSSVVIKSLFEAGCLGVRQFHPSWLTRVRLLNFVCNKLTVVCDIRPLSCFCLRVKAALVRVSVSAVWHFNAGFRVTSCLKLHAR